MSDKKLEPTVKRKLVVHDSLTVLERQLRDAKNSINGALRALEFLKAQL